ncbi:MAG: Ig-like domain-containing protein [Gemmatimonadales bacterium]
MRVQVRDAYGNGISNATVGFSVTAGGGSISPATVATDGEGKAAAQFRTGAAGGENVATATISGLPPVMFSVTAVAPPRTRTTADRPDEVSGNQVHIMYVLPSDGVDRSLDLNQAIVNSVSSFQNWLAGQTGGRELRIDTFDGSVDVTFFRLPRSDAQMISYGAFVRDTIEKEAALAGFATATKIYAVYYDGGSTRSCGGGAWPPALPGRVAAMYLQGTPPGAPACNTNSLPSSPTAAPGYLDFAMLHEIMHTMGFVASNAPNHTLSGHVAGDPRDLMYAGSLPWAPSILDVGKDDYFGPNVPAGVLNLQNSLFLKP